MVYGDTKRDTNIPTNEACGGCHYKRSLVMLIPTSHEDRINRQLDNIEAKLKVNAALIGECLVLVRNRVERRAELATVRLAPAPVAQELQAVS